ncbi:MAG: four helix bundle protein [Acidobacteria bacterium]|nr:four helix bundle protein [Acidobacteriota bacterium]
MSSEMNGKTDPPEDPSGYRNLRVWEKSFELAVAIFKIADKIPQGLGISLNAQMRIAALSIPSYIARGQSRASGKEFLRGLYLAQGALSELETHLFLCAELGYATELEMRRVDVQIREIRRMSSSVISRLRAAAGSGSLQSLSEEIAAGIPAVQAAGPGK